MKKIAFLNKISSLSLVHFYLVPDSYSRAQTRESVESAKKWLEYESFEYESRLDTALVRCELWKEVGKHKSFFFKFEYKEKETGRYVELTFVFLNL